MNTANFKMKKFLCASPWLALLVIPLISAHEETTEIPLIYLLKQQSLTLLSIGILITIFVVALSLRFQKTPELFNKTKKLLFLILLIPVLIISWILIGSTIAVNIISETGGPVHRHADFEIWRCGELVDIVDPKGIMNRVGTPLLHEHSDNRIHVEGTLLEEVDSDLHTFFEAIGGDLTNEEIRVPTNEGLVTLKDGDTCNGEPAELQFFLYRITNPDPAKRSGFLYEQIKLEDFEDYLLAPYLNVPPGDCFIIELAPEKEKTENECTTYKVAKQKGDIKKVE